MKSRMMPTGSYSSIAVASRHMVPASLRGSAGHEQQLLLLKCNKILQLQHFLLLQSHCLRGRSLLHLLDPGLCFPAPRPASPPPDLGRTAQPPFSPHSSADSRVCSSFDSHILRVR